MQRMRSGPSHHFDTRTSKLFVTLKDMFGIIARRVALIIAGLVFVGTVTQVDRDRLYTTCPAGSERYAETIPIEAGSDDPAFFAVETIEPSYAVPGRMQWLGFTHVVGMFNVVTSEACDRGEPATIELRSLALIEEDIRTGDTRAVATVTFAGDTLNGETRLEHRLFYRKPWFTSGVPAAQPVIAAIEDGVYWLNARFVPKAIIHGWTTPRVPTEPGKRYLVEAEVRVTGAARIQLGMDYWRGAQAEYNGWSAGCETSNNCQAWLSDWLGDTGGEFVTWRAPVRPER